MAALVPVTDKECDVDEMMLGAKCSVPETFRGSLDTTATPLEGTAVYIYIYLYIDGRGGADDIAERYGGW